MDHGLSFLPFCQQAGDHWWSVNHPLVSAEENEDEDDEEEDEEVEKEERVLFFSLLFPVIHFLITNLPLFSL